MSKSQLSEWFTEKYLQWQMDRKEVITLSEFANYLGISRSYLSMLMNGERESLGADMADKIAIHYPEIYELTGLEPKDPLLALIQVNWDHLDEPTKDEINRLIEPYTGGRPANDEPQTDPRPAPNLGTS